MDERRCYKPLAPNGAEAEGFQLKATELKLTACFSKR